MLKIDLKCPVEVLGYHLVRAEDGNSIIVTMVLHNLSESIVTDIYLTVDIYNSSEKLLGSVEGAIHDLAIPPNGEYHCRLSLQGSQEMEGIDIIFNSISFLPEQIWVRDVNEERIPLEIPQTIDAQLNDLRDVTGVEGACFAADLNNRWRCICGRINDNSAPHCVRCGEEKEYALRHYTTEAVSRLIMMENSNKIKKRMRVRKFLPIIIPLCIVLVVFGFFFTKDALIPYAKYERGINYMESANYVRAQTTFDSLGEYKDSRFLAKYCAAYDLLSNQKFDEASEAFEKLSGNAEYPDMAKECQYLKAIHYLENGDNIAAAEQFGTLIGYKDSEERMKRCYYDKALEYMKSENPFPAITILELIPDYEDADELLHSMPLQFYGKWQLNAETKESPHNGEVITIGMDGSLTVPEDFFGVKNTRDPMHIVWNELYFDVLGETNKPWGTISISENESQDEISIVVQSKKNKSNNYRYHCERVPDNYVPPKDTKDRDD